MSGDLGFYIDMLERAAGSSGGVGDDLAAIVTRLRDGTARFQGVWGNDRYGEQFAETYIPARDALLIGKDGKAGALPGLAEIFHEIEGAQTEGAKALRKQEDHNTSQFV
jgi:hypothetical protein